MGPADMDVHSSGRVMYNEPLLRGCTTLSLMHQVQVRGRKGEGKGKGGYVHAAHRRGETTARMM